MYLSGRAIARTSQQEILAETLARALAAGARGVVAFDLDSTIFDNRPRQALILREYGAAHGIAALAAARPEHWTSWSIADAMRKAGLDEEAVAAHADEARSWWRPRFFSSGYCTFDIAIAGAAEFLAAVGETGAKIAYVTGRHEAMGPGSVAAMRASGFPLPNGERVHLLLKPSFEQADDAWKEQAVARLTTLGSVVAAFDNEPAHINVYARLHPDALAVHLATDHSGRPIPLHPGVPSIADFRR